MMQNLAIGRVTARVHRAPLPQPATTSFGTMRDRPMVLVEVEGGQGARGWGEGPADGEQAPEEPDSRPASSYAWNGGR